MTPSMWFLFFTVQILLNVSVNGNIDPLTLEDVFGATAKFSRSRTYAVHAYEPSVQAVAVTPDNATLVDPDYWDSDDFQSATFDYDKFDLTLTKRVFSINDKNSLLSPLGLKLALAILYEAATGPTKNEIASVVGFDLDRKEVRRKFSTIIESLKKESPEYILSLNSRIYVNKNAEPRQRFAAIAQEFYKTELKNVNFFNPDVAANEINAWVSNTTYGNIPKLVEPDDMIGMVVLILNTLYFKGSWRHQFPPNATKPGPFYVTPKSQKTVQFMNVKDQFYFTESANLDAKILRMPYRSNKYAMYIIVPNSLTGLPRVLNNLSDLRVEINNLIERLVDVTLPKFQFEHSSRLNAILIQLGIRQAFELTASFPGISRGQRLDETLRVSNVLQTCGIEVNEVGSIAYAATQVGIVNKFGEDSDVSFEVVANRPFLFLIQDELTRQLLFIGRVSDPTIV